MMAQTMPRIHHGMALPGHYPAVLVVKLGSGEEVLAKGKVSSPPSTGASPTSASLWKPLGSGRWKGDPADHVGCSWIRNQVSVLAAGMSAYVYYYTAWPMAVKTVRSTSFVADQKGGTARGRGQRERDPTTELRSRLIHPDWAAK